MKCLKIQDIEPNGNFLSVDLKEVLLALGALATSSLWRVALAEPWDGEFLFEATGDGAAELEHLAETGLRISGLKLQDIANRTRQVIWGIFAGFKAPSDEIPWIFIHAFDSSWFEVHTDSDDALELIYENFSKVSPGESRVFHLDHS